MYEDGGGDGRGEVGVLGGAREALVVPRPRQVGDGQVAFNLGQRW